MTPEQGKALKVLQRIRLDTGLTGTVVNYVKQAGREGAPMQDDLNGIIAYVARDWLTTITRPVLSLPSGVD